jgi:hypothetical protein
MYILYSEPVWRMSQNYSLAYACPQNEFYIRKPTQSETFKSPSLVAVCFPPLSPWILRDIIFRFLNDSECRYNRVLVCVFFFYFANEIRSVGLLVSVALFRNFSRDVDRIWYWKFAVESAMNLILETFPLLAHCNIQLVSNTSMPSSLYCTET